MTKRLLRRNEAALYLNCLGLPTTAASLATAATRGGGPPYRKFGRYAVYEIADLDSWVARRISGRLDSTSTPYDSGDLSYLPLGDIGEIDDYPAYSGQLDFDEVTRQIEEEQSLIDAMNSAADQYNIRLHQFA